LSTVVFIGIRRIGLPVLFDGLHDFFDGFLQPKLDIDARGICRARLQLLDQIELAGVTAKLPAFCTRSSPTLTASTSTVSPFSVSSCSMVSWSCPASSSAVSSSSDEAATTIRRGFAVKIALVGNLLYSHRDGI
jgi:hypothetical protein